jgi:mono/diheme cytochrome c family protein
VLNRIYNVRHILQSRVPVGNGGRRWGARRYVLLAGLVLALVLTTGCARGSYPLDIFYEMHYQQSFRSHEPPRLSVPQSAVPWFPAPQPTSFAGDGRHLYEVNCSMCHGNAGRGDGPVLERMISAYGYQPAITPDLTAPQVMAAGVPGVEAFVINGVVVMPAFAKLLTPEEIRLTSEYVVNCLQGQQPQACP